MPVFFAVLLAFVALELLARPATAARFDPPPPSVTADSFAVVVIPLTTGSSESVTVSEPVARSNLGTFSHFVGQNYGVANTQPTVGPSPSPSLHTSSLVLLGVSGIIIGSLVRRLVGRKRSSAISRTV